MGIASAVREDGYESLLLELRGHGDRPGPCTLGLREADDVAVVLQWIRDNQEGTPLPIGVLGLSMGAALACHVALCHPEIRAVVADSPYAHVYPVIRYNIQRRYNLPACPWAWVTWWCVCVALRRGTARLSPATYAARLRQPLLAIQGGNDAVVPASEGEIFYERWGGPKERWFEPTVAHVEMFKRDPQAYRRRVVNFLDRVMA